jgi:hypothetical protein
LILLNLFPIYSILKHILMQKSKFITHFKEFMVSTFWIIDSARVKNF